ncbi:sensor histidine kinase KdpD [Seleniivibrio woodruffii]|uniref:sensor histidine kinase KdpD n=1 Tax=Seleniivibrio woodruffii TaxID=1078050 RepID=UPI00240A45B5|nr:sensor histidine kinase KdpD [Seleniivibrio woodruffii]
MNGERADSFLRMIKQAQRGRLKIYLGYAAGVGKTYKMLQEAHKLKSEGIDVVVGYAETHGRKETEALLEGLETVPQISTSYRGIDIHEMDTAGIIARRPEAVIVDELAHTNVPGSRHSKRWQDVEELRSVGIHVISALNVQHIESLYDTIEKLTNVKVKERIPDRVIAEADQIVNVDVTAEDLRQRLSEGKVYIAEKIEAALENFFRINNLEHLRELTLRELAAHIDFRQRTAEKEEMTANPDQVMVCLSSKGPNSGMLLRYASRLAGKLNRNWYALYVETSKEKPEKIDAHTQRLLGDTLELAQELGATVYTYRSDDIVGTILKFAEEHRVGHIVIGSPGRKLPYWKRVMGDVGLAEKLINASRGENIVVLNTRRM